MAIRSRSSSKLLIPVALLAMLAAGVAVTSPRKAAESIRPSASVSPEAERRDIRARQLIFRSEDLREVPEEWERTWEREMPDTSEAYKKWGGVI